VVSSKFLLSQKAIGITLEGYSMIDLKSLIKAGVPFGHQTWRWCPKMEPYIWGQKNSIHLIDVSATARQLEKATKFLEEVASQGKPILLVGTKKAAQNAIDAAAQKLQISAVTNRWIGGTLTNFPQVKKAVTKLLHYEDILAKSDAYSYTKKERAGFQKLIDRLVKNVGGIRKLTWPVGALVVIDVRKEHVAVKEAYAAGIPVVALVDTNCDPSFVDYVIPGNDDLPRSIEVILNYLAEGIARGQVVMAARPQDEVTSENSIEQLLKQALGEDDEEEKAARRKTAAGTVRSTTAKKPTARPRQSRERQVFRKPAGTEETASEVVESEPITQ
jgi:small subunit ribosomal protein S2